MLPSAFSGDEKSVESSVVYTPIRAALSCQEIDGRRPNLKARK
jgi:hypothetical protein